MSAEEKPPAAPATGPASPPAPAPPPRSGRRRLLRRLLWLGATLFLLSALWRFLVRPPVPDVSVPDPGVPAVSGRLSRLGDSVLEGRDGYWFFLHRGDSVTLGAQHAALGEFLVQRVEDAMFADFSARLPFLVRMSLPPVLLWQYRHMARYVPEEQRHELWAFSKTYRDRYGFPLTAYERGLYYHALHDITQELVGNRWVNPAVAGACTAFAASGPATTDGHLLVGRNFDFEVFPLFDQEKVVHLFARDGAIPVLSISWMAMAGVVTGMNADGIWMSLNAARSEGRNRKGPPVALWIRWVLEQARSIEDVERLLRQQAPMVTDIYVVGDGKSGATAVIERGQSRMDVRRPRAGHITAANHLISPTFSGDAKDKGLRDYSSTLARGLRMQELVERNTPLDLPRALSILRDRKGPGDIELAPGNRNALDALIASHSVVADVTDRVLWVSTAPHTQGPYRAVDLLGELDRAGVDTSEWRKGLAPGARAWERGEAAPPSDLPPGELYAPVVWREITRYFDLLRDAETYLHNDEPVRALDMALRAEALQPASADGARLAGDALAALHRDSEARAAYERYLARLPPFGPDHARVTLWLKERGGVPDLPRPDLTAAQ
jgi:hypothetical protein